ncbi:furin-like protease 2 [Neocloeon triangulifer]|uniref:furin-like protease 2 n=1 Tax=Neocloeon triangulifer TaxID=2078957 RepID=UPI00286EE0A7|nr:furin-like protease 2 [Neocloeon triangulifer]
MACLREAKIMLVTALACVVLVNHVSAEAPKIFMNQYAVQIPNGHESASAIAQTHGFTNMGQIGELKGFYLFEHSRIHKRSALPNNTYHSNLINEPEVLWVQQQHVKRRVKRDYLSDFSPYGTFDSLFSGGVQHSRVAPRDQGSYLGARPFFPDPLFKEQWYMTGGAKDGFDMNVWPAWQKGYTGKGVVISILDDGIQVNHPDLAQNYDPLASTDINDNDPDPMPRDNGDNKHGTRCAGEVAGVAFNSICGVGIAYNASIGGVRMLDGVVNDAVEAKALGLNPAHIDIYSASWGPEDDGKTVDGPGPLARRAFIYGVTAGRNGKGSIFVWASGNGGRHTDSCNCDGYTNSIFTLSISSATQGGYKPWYLEECSSTLATTYSSGTPGHDKSVVTVDMDGRLRPDHICTVEHTGTSASAPIAAGICALALEANPTLTWRDMQYLVVLTSRSQPLEKERGWVTNGVQRKVSHKFGYGLMDAGAMVQLAEQWITVPSQHICKSPELNEEKSISPVLGQVMQSQVEVDGCINTYNEIQYLEHVQCKLTLRFFPRGNLRILLTSPMGTTSTLLFERPRDVASSNFDDWPFLSVHFWGERPEGRWTLQIVNAGNRQINTPGILKKWQLIFYGTKENPIRLRTNYPSANAASRSFSGNQYTNGYFDFQQPNQQPRLGDMLTAGSEKFETVVAPPNSTSSDASSENLERISKNCHPECSNFGCYGESSTDCVTCKNFKLNSTCVEECPQRSFPSSQGICLLCHDSCQGCKGPKKNDCLTCKREAKLSDDGLCLAKCLNQNNGDVPCENTSSTVRRAVETPGIIVVSHTIKSNYLDAVAILGAAVVVVAVIFVTIRKLNKVTNAKKWYADYHAVPTRQGDFDES